MTGIILKSDPELKCISGFRTVNTKICPPRKWRTWQHVPPGAAGLMACLLVLPSVSFAEAWVFQPSIRLEGIYDTNLRLVPGASQQVTTARISPALSLSRVTDTTNIAGLLRVDGDFYFGDTGGGNTQTSNTRPLDNTTNELADFSAFRTGELSQWGGIFSYRRDTLLRAIRNVANSPDPAINDESDTDEGLSDIANIRRQRLTLGPSWNRYLTERTQVGLSYQFSDVSYSNVPAFNPNNVSTQISDYRTHDVGAELLTEVTERDQLALIFAGTRYTADNDRRFNNYGLQTGVVHQFSETTTGIFTVGARYTTFDRPAIPGSEASNGSNTGFEFALSATKRAGLTTFSGAVERTALPSGSGNLVQTNQALFSVSRRLTERTRFLLRSRIYEIEAIDQLDSSSNRRYLSIEPALRYELSPSWGLEAGYEFRHQKRFSDTDSADDNSVYLTLDYQRPTAVEPEQPSQGIGIGSLGGIGIE